MDTSVVTCPVHRNSKKGPDRVAIRCDGASVSYGELERLVHGYALRLAAAGVKLGERIGVIACNSIDYAALIFGACRVGATLVPINVRFNDTARIDSMTRSGCRLLFVDAQRAGFARSSGYDHMTLGGGDSDGDFDFTNEADATISCNISLDLEASIMFTSGSGGVPKGAILTFGNHYHNAIASNENIRLEADDCWLAVLPFYHVGGMAVLFRAAIAGCSVCIMSDFDVDRINQLIDEGAITHISLVPSMLSSLLAAREMREAPETLRAILIGGEPGPGRLLDDIERLALPVLTSYGMTETASQVCTMSPYDSTDRLLTSGKPLRYSEVMIFDENGSPAGENVDGEIAVRGEIVFKGYLGEDVGTTFGSGGWFRTGDFGCFDRNGYLHVKGRKDGMFVSGGENIYPSEIENAAAEFPGLAECAVIAVDDDKWGRRPVLFVRREGSTEFQAGGLRSYLEARLPRIHLPKAIVEVDEFPRKSIDKIDREKLREIYLRDS